MNVVYVGNFEPPHSTENEIRRALRLLGHTVVTVQENAPDAFTRLPEVAGATEAAFVLWTRTRWHPPVGQRTQAEAVAKVRALGVPVIGYHLDIWWGLKRAVEIQAEPFFTATDLVCTADGGHDELWAAAGVDHAWFPPAIGDAEAARTGTALPEYGEHAVAFVGCWDGSYHPESKHRHALVAHLQARGDVSFWPKKGEKAVRGQALANLYATVPVIVGDSCHVDDAGRYWSDRVPETFGRGGFLLHPVTGPGDGQGLGFDRPSFDWFDFAELDRLIGYYLGDGAGERTEVASAARQHVRRFHTYSARMESLIGLLTDRGMI